MSKVIVLPYESPRCVVCGRDLPKGRRQKCYACRPSKAKRPIRSLAPEQSRSEPYTIADRVAQAWAYGLSYGQLMAIVEHGEKLPPRKRPLVWPEGSAHAGE